MGGQPPTSQDGTVDESDNRADVDERITCVLGHTTKLGTGGLGEVHADICQLIAFRSDCCGETFRRYPSVVNLTIADKHDIIRSEEVGDSARLFASSGGSGKGSDDVSPHAVSFEAPCLVNVPIEDAVHVLARRCSRVICCPPSSADGMRPRPLLDGPARAPLTLGRFIDVC